MTPTAAGEGRLDPAALRIAVVGPTHPIKGGVAVHTTEVAHHLRAAGHDVTLVSWTQLYPARLYPGEMTVPGDQPEVTPFPGTIRPLHWAKPLGWRRTGGELAAYDLVVVVHIIPQVVPAHLTLIRAASAGPQRPRVVALVHNVLPHEPKPGDEALMRAFLTRVDGVIVHTPAQRSAAIALGAQRVRALALPPHLPGGPRAAREPYAGPARLVALGIVRAYKGLEPLLDALAQVPDLTLTIAGEAWGDLGERLKARATDPALSGRVTFREGYVPAAKIAPLLARHDVMTLTYTSATASQNALLAQTHGLAVLASTVGSFPHDVHDGVDGLLVPPGDVEAIVEALRYLRDRRVVDRMMAAAPEVNLTGAWADYVGALEAFAADSVAAGSDAADGVVVHPRRDGGSGADGGTDAGVRGVAGGLVARAFGAVGVAAERVRDGARGLVAAAKPRVDLAPADLPDWVRPTDVLARDDDAAAARALARSLGLPRRGSRVEAWAALGGIAAVLRVRDDGSRSSIILDRSGGVSPFLDWARAIGFAPVVADPGDELDIEPESLDVMTRLHPADVEAGDVLDLFGQAAWALRPGGLLITTFALGPGSMPGMLGAADVRAVLAQADNAGLRLVGDLDGDLTATMRRAQKHARDPRAAYGLARLTWRRR